MRDHISKFAQSIPGKYTEIFSKLALEHNFYVIMGSMIEKEEDKYYNTSILIDPQGDILGKYRKIFLWHPAKDHIERGYETPVFKVKFGMVGIEICWDLPPSKRERISSIA